MPEPTGAQHAATGRGREVKDSNYTNSDGRVTSGRARGVAGFLKKWIYFTTSKYKLGAAYREDEVLGEKKNILEK